MSRTVNVYLSGNPVHDRVLEAFYNGCPEKKQLLQFGDYEPSDVAVIFGVYKSKVPASWERGRVFRQQREKNLDVVVLETGYVNRGDGEDHHYAAGFNGLNGRADFRNEGMPSDRWNALGVSLKPYRRGEHIILCGQVPWDASVDHVDLKWWLLDAASRIRMNSWRKIIYRPHPLARKAIPEIYGCETSTVPLSEDLKDAHAVVTFNSNSGVEALIDGVPVFAFDEGSMVWNVANSDMKELHDPKTPGRQQWANNLAYCQWTPAEMQGGMAWKHLFH